MTWHSKVRYGGNARSHRATPRKQPPLWGASWIVRILPFLISELCGQPATGQEGCKETVLGLPVPPKARRLFGDAQVI